MSRDQRCGDNWALLYTQQLAFDFKLPLTVVFCLVPAFLGTTIRQYRFMLEGLKQVERRLLANDWKAIEKNLRVDPSVAVLEWIKSG